MFDHCIYFNTAALARQLEREWAVAFEPFDLSPPQAFMLRVILAKPGILQKDLANELGISRPTATRALDHLSRKQLVRRRGSDQDGREIELVPTEKAVSMQESITVASGSVTKKIKKIIGDVHFAETVDKVRGVRSALK
jgi:MarR family transcriptional regulator, temperature-dependent positive regulator of motility